MAIARIRVTPVDETLKPDRYLSRDFRTSAKKRGKIALFTSILLLASIILNIYQYLH